MKYFATVLLFTPSFAHAAQAEFHWNTSFKETYRNQAEGAEVSFTVRSPPRIARREKYPLLIALSGGFRVSPSEQFPFFQANPTRTRIWGYRSLSTYDSMQVVRLMKEKYPIDPDRVYLMGFSAGGSGAMHLASCFPDQFAAVLPLVAAGNNYPLANFKNLPVAFHHGDRDWTSAICNARVQAQRMKALGCPVILQEYPAGHSVPGSHLPLARWLFEQKRNPRPSKISHDCEAVSLGRSYWFQIREFGDPHQRASVEATIRDAAIIVRPKNINAFSLDRKKLGDIKSVRIGDAHFKAASQFRFHGGQWKAVDGRPNRSNRLYEAGAAANLYQGEPLLIVYGTKGDRRVHLKSAAQKLARYGGPVHTTLPRMLPVVADRDVTPQQEASANLVLIGKPEENSVSQTILPKLSVRIQDGVLKAGDRAKLPLANQVLSLLHPHPSHPNRLVYFLSPFTNDVDLIQFVDSPQTFLAGSDGFDRVSQADLLVQNVNHQIARQMQFDKEWNWIEFPRAEKPIPARYAHRASLAVTYMGIMKEKSAADFALWWGPADKGMWGADFNDLESYNPEFYTEADFRTQRRLYDTMIGGVSGAEFKGIWKRWGVNGELQCVPAVTLDEIQDEKEYRVHIPMDLYIKLGRRKKNLENPQAGPSIPAAEVLAEIFK